MPLLGASKSSSDMTPITTTTSSIFSEQLTASTFWLLGVLVSICLVLLALMGILVGRYRWWRRRLNVFYAAGSEGAFTDYRAQYLLRLSFERDPTKVALRRRHTDDCQVWLRLSYEDGPRDGLTVPLMINKIYQFNGKPTAQVLLRTQRPLLNARSLSASLFCVDGCPARRNAEEDAAKSKTNSRSRSCSSDLPPPPPPPPGQPPRSLDGQLFASLQAFTASLQAVPSRYSLSTKVLVLGAEPRSYFVLSGGQNNRRRCLMEHERTYSLAIESRQQIDYHPLRAAVTCPSDGLVVFNYLAAALTFLLLAAGEVQFQVVGAGEGGDELLWLLLVVLPALVGALFLLSGHYLFVTHLQDRLLGRSLGRSTGAWLLHYGLLTVLTVFGLLCCLGAVTLIAAGVDIAAGGGGGGGGGHHDHHSSTTSSSSSSSSTTTEKDSGSKTPSSSAKHHHHHPHHLNIASFTTFLLVALSWTVLFAIEGVLALLDHFFRCFNGVLSGGSFCACCCCCCWCCGFGFCGCSSSCCDDPEESCPRLRNLPATSTAAAVPTEEFGRRGGGRKGGRKGGGKKGGGKKSRGKRKGRNSSSK